MLKFHFLRGEVEGQIKGVQPTHQNQLEPTQSVGLGQFLGFSGFGWVTNFFFYSGSCWVELGSGHKIPNPSNLTRLTHIFNIYYIINNFFLNNSLFLVSYIKTNINVY